MKEVTDTNFNEYLDTTRGRCVMLFYANWNGPSSQFRTNFAQLESSYSEVNFAQSEVDPNPSTYNRFTVHGVPCVKVFEHTGSSTTVLGTLYGDSSKDQIKQFIDKHV